MPNTQSVHRSIKDIRERVRAKETIASLVDIVDGAGHPHNMDYPPTRWP